MSYDSVFMTLMVMFCVFLFLFLISLIGLGICQYQLRRNNWVYDQRIKLFFEDYAKYKQLPSYEYMLYKKWWVWDINKFLWTVHTNDE